MTDLKRVAHWEKLKRLNMETDDGECLAWS